MDPYLEGQMFWPDFHARFIPNCCDALADRLPDHYEVRIDERVSLVDVPSHRNVQRLEPDMAISQSQPRPSASPTSPGAVATLEPITIPLILEEERTETYIEILHRPERNLIAVLEVLSPSNKEDPGYSSYLAKRNGLLHHHVHLVEIDLLLAGRRLELQRPLPPGDYYALIANADRRPDCDVYAWTIRQALPALPIPLAGSDPAILLDLGAVFAATYQRGRYARSIDYRVPPAVPLRAEDRDWALEQTQAARSTPSQS
jgi:hypothetical protein